MLIVISGESPLRCSDILLSVIEVLKEGKDPVSKPEKTFRLHNKLCKKYLWPRDGCDRDNHNQQDKWRAM